MKELVAAIQGLLERRPAFGWIGAITSSGSAMASIVQHAISVLTIISLLIGITTGGITLYLQIRALRRKKKDE